MKNLVIDRRLVRSNLKAVKERAEGAALYADLSANAYGMGLLEIAELLRGDGVRTFAVSDARDARLLREKGFTEEQIMMLRSTADPKELGELIDLGVICTVGSYDAGVAINGIAEARKTIAEVQIKVDSGFGRYGFLPNEIDKMANIFKYMSNLAIIGMFTTYAAPCWISSPTWGLKQGSSTPVTRRRSLDMITSTKWTPCAWIQRCPGASPAGASRRSPASAISRRASRRSAGSRRGTASARNRAS
jgi:predicted amino acid racemase